MRRAYTRSKVVRAGRSQRGFTLLEIMVVMGLSLIIMTAGTGYVVRHTEGMANEAAAEHLKSIAGAARDYARDNEEAILATLDGAPTAEVSIPMLKAQDYLPPSVSAENNYGQGYLVRFTKTPTGELEGLIVTQGGEAIKGLNKRKIAQSIGAAGGFLDEATMTTLSGSYGSWERSLSDFGIGPGEAELAYALFVDKAINKGSLADQYLSRREIPGMPQLNRMEANLDMAGNAVSNVGHIDAQTAWVSSLEAEDLTTGGLAVSGEATFTGRTVFQNRNGRGPVVDRINSTGNSSIEYRTTGGSVFAGAATPNTFAVGGDANINSPSNRWFEVGPAGAKVGGESVWTTATFDPASKAEAEHLHSASEISSGTLDPARIPTLDASKIASGVLSAAHIPNLNANKITAGTMNLARLPALPISKVSGLQASLDSKSAVGHGHSAADVTTGVFSTARIPAMDADKIASGVLGAARIPNLNASKITAGSLHVNRIPTLPISKIDGLQTALDGKADVGHKHSASDITSGTLHVNRIPALPISKVTGLQSALDGKASLSHQHDASDISSGTLSSARIPNLNASKITAGTLHVNRIPSLPADRITSGTFAAARIPNLPASQITSGTFSTARIPTLPISKISGLQAELDGKLDKSGGTMTGALSINAGNRPLNFYGGSGRHAYMQWFVESSTSTRSAYLGFGSSSSSSFTISNDKSGGNIVLSPGSGGRVTVGNSTVWHAGNFNPDSKADASHTHSASDITSGTLHANRIPNLNASKITAGTFHSDRIPNLNASKITAGTLHANRIPNLNASKITAGTLNADRIPTLSQSKVSGLEDDLDSKLNLSGGTMTGALTALRFRPTQTASCNSTCSGNGWLARTSSGAVLSCDNGRWRGYSCGTGGGGTPPPQGGCPGEPQPPGCQPLSPSGWYCNGEIRQCR